MRLVVATTNPHKVDEIRELLARADVELTTLAPWPDLDAPEETGSTFEDNARQKAIYYARATGATVVADDSGFEIDALGGIPGVESARYGGAGTTYPQKFALIADAMRAARASSSLARFVCAVAVADPDRVIFETRGVVEGELAPEAKGTGGFGYDPIFYYPPLGRTFGEVTREEKGRVSHRGRAFRALAAFLRTMTNG